jgi:hypothetical protein
MRFFRHRSATRSRSRWNGRYYSISVPALEPSRRPSRAPRAPSLPALVLPWNWRRHRPCFAGASDLAAALSAGMLRFGAHTARRRAGGQLRAPRDGQITADNYPPSRSTPTLRPGRSARLNLLLTISEHHRTSPAGHACGPSPHLSRRRLFDLSAWWSKRHVGRQSPPRGKSASRIQLDDCWRFLRQACRWRLRLFGFAPELTRSALPFALGDATLSAGCWRNCTTWRGAATMCLSSNQAMIISACALLRRRASSGIPANPNSSIARVGCCKAREVKLINVLQ